MILIIMRHGEAVPYQINDKSRVLTRFGVSQSEAAGKRLARFLESQGLPASIDQVLVSPYLRTQQTFEAVSESISFAHKTDTDAITPMGESFGVHDIIAGYAHGDEQGLGAAQQLMLISHMPLVSLLADKVCAGFHGKIFDTADILVIDYDPATNTGAQLALFQSMN
ncbi:phosphohistidine phosphatase SixA [Glaciecola sp. SC05]|uniref:phosphohistidine phosphatase SixA n=1 Tax=Glaciecola sp. SC05 TaxID=1987355 RepID=UPI003528423A